MKVPAHDVGLLDEDFPSAATCPTVRVSCYVVGFGGLQPRSGLDFREHCGHGLVRRAGVDPQHYWLGGCVVRGA